jgi:chromate transport protein ChrA
MILKNARCIRDSVFVFFFLGDHKKMASGLFIATTLCFLVVSVVLIAISSIAVELFNKDPVLKASMNGQYITAIVTLIVGCVGTVVSLVMLKPAFSE